MSSSKAPAMQFYVGDWFKDLGVRSCSLAARGLWFDMCCFMWTSPRRGFLLVDDGRGGQRGVSQAQLARMTGADTSETQALLAELGEAGVYSVDDTGAIYCRRMVRDERLRLARAAGGPAGAAHGAKGAEFGVLGGRPKGGIKGGQKPPFEPPPSSSTDSASAAAQERERAAGTGGAAASSSALAPGLFDVSAARVAKALRQSGIRCAAHHPQLVALLAAGVPESEITATGVEAEELGRQTLGWVIATIRGRRRDAEVQPEVGRTAPRRGSRTEAAIDNLRGLAHELG